MNAIRSARLTLALLAGACLAAGPAVGRGVAEAPPAPVRVDVTQPPPRWLSAYNFFLDGARQLPNAGVAPYDLNTPLFSDYTAKHRFVWMPPGANAAYDPEAAFAFPVGTVLIKTFTMPHDLRDPSAGERLLETRLLAHRPEGWVGLPYVWNAEQTDAELKVAGKTVDVTWIHYDGRERANNYIIPNANQCKGCHENADAMGPIGPKARNLNKDYPYAHGAENQLAHWTAVGYLSGAPQDPAHAPRLPVWDDSATGTVAERARAYLEANCMHCHNPDGPANTSGLDLRFNQTTPVKYGVYKTPVAAGRGSGNLKFAIAPGDPDASFLVYRLASTDPGVMMPELPRRLVHEEGLALVREWIAGMNPAEFGAAPAG